MGKFSKDLVILVDGPETQGGSILPLPDVNDKLRKVLIAAFPQASDSTFAKSDRTLTSGFVGIAVMMHLCDKVALYEMVPSTLEDKTAAWHYYERGGIAQSNPWHNSIPYEAAFWRALALTDSSNTGKLLLNGFRLQEEICKSSAASADDADKVALWASWGYKTKGHEINPQPGMWVPPPGG